MKTSENIIAYKDAALLSVDPGRYRILQRWSVYLTIAVIIIALLVLTGWEFDISVLKRPVNDLPAMNPTTALSFLLCGISLLLLRRSASSKKQELTGKIFAGLVIFIALLRLISPALSIDQGIDTFLFNSKLSEDAKLQSSNRMVLNTAFTFIITGLCLLLTNTDTKHKRMPAHAISVFIFFVAIISILGYLYNIKITYGSFIHIPVALHTAIGFLFISLAILFLQPGEGITKEITSRFSGSFIARFLIPVAIVVPAMLGLIYMEGVRRGNFSLELGTSFFAMSVMLIFISLTWFIVVVLNKRDLQKAETDLAIWKFNQALEQKIQERTETIDRSEKQYSYLFKNNPMPMWVIDLNNFKFLDVNEMAIFHYGYSRQEFLSMTALDIRPEADQEIFKQADHAFASTTNNYRKGTWNHLKKDGTLIKVDVIGHEIIFEGAKARLVMANDVTEQKLAEESLIASESRFRALIENNHDMISLMDAQMNIIYRSPSVFRITGWSNREYQQMDAVENIHPDDVENTKVQIGGLIASPGSVIQIAFRTLHKDGHYLRVEGSITNLLADEHIKAIVFNFRDVTSRVEAEEKLAAKEMHFRSLIENSAEGISLTDAMSNNIYRSPAAEKIMGNIPTGNSIMLTHPEDAAMLKQKHIEVLKNPGVPISFLGRFLHADGNYIWLEGTFTNLLQVKDVNAIVANYRNVTERKELEDLLHSANVLARIGGWEIDLKKQTVYWSDITKEIHETDYNYEPDLATGINFYKEGPERELIQQKVKEAIELGKPWDEELQIITAKNNLRWIRTIGKAELVNGECIRVYGSFQDIDERKRAEEKVIASEKQFRSTLDNMLEGAQIIGFDWKYIYINDSLAKHAKFKRDEMLGYTVMEKFPGIEETEIFKVYQRCFEERVSIHMENEFRFPDGTVGWFELSFQPIPEGIFILSIDITDRKNAEAAIIRAEANYREIFDKASDGIYVHDIPDGNIIDTNERAAEITGYSKEEILTIWSKIFVTGSKVHNISPAIIHFQKAAAGEPQLFEWLSRKKDGNYSWLEVNLKKANIAGEERILSFFREINDRKKAQEQVKKLNEELEQKVVLRTQQLKRTYEELEAFSYSVSHDLRAPLRAIIGFSTILQEDYITKLGDEAKRITNVIISNTKKMGQLIDDLLTFSRMGRQHILATEINNNELVSEVIEELDKKENRHKKINWSIHNLPPVKADLNIMRQVWINLISNAVKYSEKVAEPHVEIGASETDDEVTFYVKDNGVGFDEKYKDKLFKVFQRLHTNNEFEGTGIGLAIVEKIISRHGGKVWAHAEVDKGACFYFSLPVTVNEELLI